MMMCWGSSSTGALSRAMARVGLEELIGDVAQDGSAARGDAALSDQGKEANEELTEVDGAGELGELGKEVGGEVLRVAARLRRGGGVAETEMVRTKSRVRL